MNKISHLIVLLACMFIYSSCGSYKKFDYARMESPKSLDGIYINQEYAITRGLNLTNYAFKDTDLFRFEFQNDTTLHVSYLTDAGYSHIRSYNGKHDPEEQTFEIIFDKKVRIYLLVNRVCFDKVRLGKGERNRLVINKVDDGFGSMAFIAGGSNYGFVKAVEPATENTLIPVKSGRLWGYHNAYEKIVIEPVYEQVEIFDRDIARVKQSGKWIVIDRQGNQLTRNRYIDIRPFADGISALVTSDSEKYGFINRQGEEIVPPIYDHIDDFNKVDSLTTCSLDSKIGILSRTHIIYPPIFEKVIIDAYNRKELIGQLPSYIATVRLNGLWLVADKEGNLYKTGDHLMKGQRVKLRSKRHYSAYTTAEHSQQ
ncbi:WG repeat-containing protein [Dysgonomonas sp. OttesenSCG-928-M03]|nr:WG repeat-containing protein [Dysgonomonas sp. OttesenSCG-928-M03]